jgi:hypothetical protein
MPLAWQAAELRRCIVIVTAQAAYQCHGSSFMGDIRSKPPSFASGKTAILQCDSLVLLA